MSEDQNSVVTLKVRVTPEFREKIVNTAKKNNRSMNAEIVARLEQSFISDHTHQPIDISAKIAEIQHGIEKQELVLEKLLQLGNKIKNPDN